MMVHIKINGKELTVPADSNVLEAALDAGIYIPHLCHHKDLFPLGSCRMCVVEVDGQQGVTTACTLKASEGLSIRTESNELRHLRMLALELLLTGHPEDCTTCPKYGNCELQALIQYIGPKTGRMKMRTKGFTPNEENPLLTHDMNRCVLCGRCVRACKDLRNVGVLDYRKNGVETYVGTLHDRLLKDVDCRFCTACAAVCPTGTIRDKLRRGQENWPKEARIVPCRYSCPAQTDVPRYVRYIKEGKYDEAAAVIREKVPFPKVLGYICTRACEDGCKRSCINEPISIRNLKRYAAEQDTGALWRGKGKQMPDTGKKVCVIGGGPAGLTAAYYLRKQGHAVTLKEALPTVGGMMSYGIPAYRLPREIIKEEVQVIVDAGVQIQCNARVERPVELLKEYDAVLVAVGCHSGVRLPMTGSDLPGVLLNVEFLQKAAMGQETGLGKRVVVLGGGNVAFDCARTARRLGAQEVHVACLEAREAMTADDEEIEQAMEEKIFVHPARTFECITGTDCVTGVDFMEVESFVFDENRRAIIKKRPDSEQHIDCDTVIFAVGQRPQFTEEMGVTLGRGNCVVVNGTSAATDVAGLFACGDAVYGTKSVVAAIASARDAASQIDRFLGGDGDISEVLAPVESADPKIGVTPRFADLQRREAQVDPASDRQDNFRLFDHGLTQCDAQCEASRCLQCDLRLQIAEPRVWGDFADESK